MITNALIFLAYTLLSWFIGILPESSGFPGSAHEAMRLLGGYAGIWEDILPFETLIVVIGLVFSVEVGIFVFKNIKWIISHIPIVGGKG